MAPDQTQSRSPHTLAVHRTSADAVDPSRSSPAESPRPQHPSSPYFL
ncbi:hypothetical protein PYK79_51750 [Streptomyces sp. ID05-04B]|nr:hypothetical protein [Streptomyces sp. ID05-04B]MDX5570082.1 hypothetical protein [Streptomyces sp. ID05-04B]